jgi:hypothetical protein
VVSSLEGYAFSSSEAALEDVPFVSSEAVLFDRSEWWNCALVGFRQATIDLLVPRSLHV